MDTYEATKVVMSRIQQLDPDNASKIMGYILLQDQAEKEMIRLAFGPETLLQTHIHLAKSCLGIPSTSPSSNPSTPLSNPMKPNSPFPRISIPNNGGYHFSNNNNSPSFQRASPRPFSYAAALNNNGSPTPNNNNSNNNPLSFLDDSFVDPLMSPSERSDSPVFPYGEEAQSPHPFHRRSCSVNDAVFLGEDGYNGNNTVNGWRTCMYFARGFCKNGGSCKFSHGDGEGLVDVGSPSKNLCGFDDLLRIKALQQQQRLAAMGAHHGFGYSNSKCMDLMNENPRDFLQMGLIGGANSSARQIYLTFPADSTFKEEDVSNYFSQFGPVQDVRIPYQQKRMFGFVTFVYSETVKAILAKGNPHFVCDSRVLVKPYKEKGKIPDKKQYQHLERGDYSSCLSPSSIDSREHIDLPFGSRMSFNTQEMMLRRKLEQEAELHHAIERRMMNLQLMDLKNNHFLPGFRAQISSPRQAQQLMNQNFMAASDNINQDNSEVFVGSPDAPESPPIATNGNKQQQANNDDFDFSESMEHVLPDNLFASPKKLGAEHKSVFSQASASSTVDTIPVTIPSSNNISSLKSCYLQMPRKRKFE
ncbi:hypothetical protein CASFOL_003026 [Castilleja foliolosa]|uniref:Uncharacterized protein n=1 Tax=Castilleja foliolosa TaxID=1961234 RepID=A0ABD3EGC8_9LAMI